MIGKELGTGQFGKVFLARHMKTKFVVALKAINKQQIAKYGAENQIQREIEIQSHLKHPNIIKLYSFFQDNKRYYLLLEYAPKGELYKLLKEKEKFDEKTAACVISIIYFGNNLNLCMSDDGNFYSLNL